VGLGSLLQSFIINKLCPIQEERKKKTIMRLRILSDKEAITAIIQPITAKGRDIIHLPLTEESNQ
jgi:hypothetical protein